MEFSAVQRFHSFSVKDYISEAEKYYYPMIYNGKKPKILKIFKKKINKKTYPKKILNELIKNGENINNSQILRKKN